jgi:hypothetical protein
MIGLLLEFGSGARPALLAIPMKRELRGSVVV